MWWAEFERRLRWGYSILKKKYGAAAYPEEVMLQGLEKKIKADFLESTRAALTIELSKLPLTLTFDGAMKAYRLVVNRKYPPTLGHTHKVKRSIRETNKKSEGSKPKSKHRNMS